MAVEVHPLATSPPSPPSSSASARLRRRHSYSPSTTSSSSSTTPSKTDFAPSTPRHSLQPRPGPLQSLVNVSRFRPLLLSRSHSHNSTGTQPATHPIPHPHSLMTKTIIPSSAVDGTVVYELDLDSHSSLEYSKSPRSFTVILPLETVSETPCWEEDEEDSLHQGSMSVEVSASPGTPPHLSSSKSSSYRSSSTPHADEHNDASHFEDIALTDHVLVTAQDPYPAPTVDFVAQRPLLRPAMTPLQPRHSKSHGSLRDAAHSGLKTTAQRSIYSSKSRPTKDAAPSRNGWNKSVPSFNSVLSPTGVFGQGTPSPTKLHSGQISPLRSSTRLPGTARLHSDSTPSLPLHRTHSWQPKRRKSSKELEDEYNDSDEELPEDAIIWNVPLSPRPPHSRSQSASPERGAPPSPHTGSLQEVRDFRASRTKSWDAAMRDLSKEAQALTTKLETHAGEVVGDGAIMQEGQSNGSPPRPKAISRAKTSELPPVQRSNPMIDPLPASAEKVKHLSRTRPSWLPPKSAKEERKHLKEYQRMMNEFRLAESKRNAQRETERRTKSKEGDTIAKRWIQDILPQWDTAIHQPDTRELWWRGIPTSIRGLVWSRAIGNDLHLSSRSYEAALARAKSASVSRDAEDLKSRSRRKSLSQMQTDVCACFPSVALFQVGQAKHHELLDVLGAYASYRSDTGYVRGTASVAALLLLYITSPADTFIALANLLNRPTSLALCLNDEVSTQRVYRSILKVLMHKMPKLAAHIQQSPPQTMLNQADWFEAPLTSLLTTLLPADACARLWDAMLFEGDSALIRGLVGTLSRLETRLYGDAAGVRALLGYGVSEAEVGSVEDVAGAARWAGRVGEEAKA